MGNSALKTKLSDESNSAPAMDESVSPDTLLLALVRQNQLAPVAAYLNSNCTGATLIIARTGCSRYPVNPEAFNATAPDGFCPLLIACRNGNIPIVEALLAAGAPPTAVAHEVHSNALLVAAKAGHVDLVKWLLAYDDGKQFSINVDNDNGWSILHFAASSSNAEMIKLGLERGCKPDAQSKFDQTTPLMLAASKGEIKAITLLLDAGAKVGTQDRWGQTALFHAAKSGCLESLKTIVEVGHANVHHRDKQQNTAFMIADANNMFECALYLYTCGAAMEELPRTGFGSLMQWNRFRILNPLSGRSFCSMLPIKNRVYIYGGWGHPEGFLCPYPDGILDRMEPRASDGTPIKAGRLTGFFCIDTDQVTETSFGVPAPDKHRKARAWDPETLSSCLKLSANDTICEYIGADTSAIGVVRANRPFTLLHTIAYFEVQVLSAGANGFISVGLVDEDYPNNVHPGWEQESYAYHGDIGWAFHSIGSGLPFGPRFGTGDIVGIGYSFKTGEAWFTKNGKFLGVAYDAGKHKQLFPAVGFQSPGEKIRVNFGENPFLYAFDAPTLAVVTPTLKEKDGMPDKFSSTHFIYKHMFEREGRILVFGFTPTYAPKLFTLTPSAAGEEFSVEEIETKITHADLPRRILNMEFNQIGDLLYILIDGCRFSDSTSDEVLLYSFNLVEYNMKLEEFSVTAAQGVERMDVAMAMCDTMVFHWLPGQTFAKCLDISADKPVWTDFKFRGKQPTAWSYNILPIKKGLMMTFGGWNNQSQQNNIHLLRVEGEELIWERPHVQGAVPRPRNRHGNCLLPNNTVMTFGGWNGRNYINDIELLSLDVKHEEDDLYSSFNSNQLTDFEFLFESASDRRIKAHRIILSCRSSFFRDYFKQNPTVAQMNMGKVPVELFQLLVRYWYSDYLDAGEIPPDQYRLFLENLVTKYSPEHSNRIAEHLLSARIHSPSSIQTDFSYGVDNQLFADVTFKILDSGRQFPGHKAILVGRSAYFKALLLGGLKESSQTAIDVDLSESSFLAVVNYIYTKNIDLEAIADDIVDVLVAASKYIVPDLKSYLEAVIAANLTEENVASLLIVADQQAANRLKQACIAFIRANKKVRLTPEYISLQPQIEEILATVPPAAAVAGEDSPMTL